MKIKKELLDRMISTVMDDAMKGSLKDIMLIFQLSGLNPAGEPDGTQYEECSGNPDGDHSLCDCCYF